MKHAAENISPSDQWPSAGVDQEHAQIYTITPEDDARVRRKIDMVVLPMVPKPPRTQSFEPPR